MPDHKEIYNQSAAQYDCLVAREDWQGNILRALEQITPLVGKDVVESGAGTGRLTCLLAPVVRSIRAFDASTAMLEVARARLVESGTANWTAQVGDHRAIPAGDASADIAMAGWSICYLVAWSGPAWQGEVERALAELQRVLRPGGVVVLLETLGTGHETPRPPEGLAAYYGLLEQKGFSSTWIRTDYRFESPAEAVELVRFFFGEELAAQVQSAGQVILPECTGLWWLRI